MHVARALGQAVGALLRDVVVRAEVDHERDPSHLAFCDEYGLTVARRGWARKRDVLNTLPVDRLLARLGKG